MDVLKLKSYRFNKDLVMRNLGETIMVYNPQNGDMYEMNDITAMLIGYLKEGLSGEEIIETICTEYDVDAETVLEDVTPLFERLEEIGLLIQEN